MLEIIKERLLSFRRSHLRCSLEKLLERLKNLWPDLLVKTNREGVHFPAVSQKYFGNESTLLW